MRGKQPKATASLLLLGLLASCTLPISPARLGRYPAPPEAARNVNADWDAASPELVSLSWLPGARTVSQLVLFRLQGTSTWLSASSDTGLRLSTVFPGSTGEYTLGSGGESLVPGWTYQIMIRARNSGGSTDSAIVTVHLSADPPTAATGLTATVDPDNDLLILVEWTLGTGAESQELMYRELGEPEWPSTGIGLSSDAQSYTMGAQAGETLVAGTTYEIMVRSTNQNGSADSETVSVSLPSEATDPEATVTLTLSDPALATVAFSGASSEHPVDTALTLTAALSGGTVTAWYLNGVLDATDPVPQELTLAADTLPLGESRILVIMESGGVVYSGEWTFTVVQGAIP